MRFLTLTANALWESTYHLAGWSEGATSRATSASDQVGGKGINVARVLTRLGADAEALTFLGGASGRLCAGWLDEHHVRFRNFPATAATRTGAVVRAPGRLETTFLGPDCSLDAGCLAAAAGWLDAQHDPAVLAVCGSVPGFSPGSHGPLAGALEAWARARPLVVDSYGPFLAWAVHLPCALVKINRRELGSLTGHDIPPDAVPAALRAAALRWPGVDRWVVTDGGSATWARGRCGAIQGWQPATVDEVSPVGAGDVVLAVLLDRIHNRGQGLLESLPEAMAFATAKTLAGTAVDFPFPSPGQLLPSALTAAEPTPHAG